MLTFLSRSIIQKLVTLFFVSVVSFLIIHLAPGEPSQIDPLNPKFTPEMVERMREELIWTNRCMYNICFSTKISLAEKSFPGAIIYRSSVKSGNGF
jgi:ABC-type dipeptide/oligopeptide/nickel transport system permease component